ncbi:protein cueball, partial [Halyomorpha halys]|uniref:protein cueball n=1 Tax=Halyomorpha halys TaxID=286706 RepID=UPI0006D4C977
CRWLLDSSGLPEADVEIVIYLTQLFVTSGLTFTEYAFYDPLDSSLQRNPSLLLSITEQNSVITRWLSTRSRFLLVELELDRLEGNHLRALDNLLDVYGFNITYQMVTGPVSNTSCSVMDCSFAGNCYVSSDYRHAGKYPTCTCPPGFTGSTCEVALLEGGCRGDGECSVQCRNDGSQEDTCGCSSNSIRVEAACAYCQGKTSGNYCCTCSKLKDTPQDVISYSPKGFITYKSLGFREAFCASSNLISKVEFDSSITWIPQVIMKRM